MLKALLPPGSKQRTVVIVAAAAAVLLVYTQVILPGNRGNGTPSAKLFEGLVIGLLNALLAAGIILIYRTTRIINFAQGALGAAGGVFTFNLGAQLGWSFFITFPAGVLVAGMIGLVVELGFIRRFFDAPRLVLTVISIALIGFLSFLSGFVGGLPIFGEARDRDIATLSQAKVPIPFEDFVFQVGSFPLEFGFPHLFAILAAAASLLGLGYFFRFTRAGVAVRASAENTDRALLLGINVKGLSTLVWVIAGVLSGVSVICTTTIQGFTGSGDFSPAVLLNALAAAVIAKMRSLPVAIAASVMITIAREAISLSYPDVGNLVDVALFAVVLVALLLHRQKAVRSEATEATSWKATEEQRPIPKELMEITGVKIWRWVLIGIGLIAVLLFPWVATPGATNRGGLIAIIGIVVLSLVVLTGWAGQVSLGQFGFVAVGAVVGGALTQKVGISFWLALPIGAIVTAAFAVLIGLPALRIRGLFLAVTTFAFAFAVQAALFKEKYFGWLLSEKVDRPELFIFNFEDERSMYYLTIIALLLTVIVVTTLRRSRAGRVLIAMRDNEANVQSFGINVMRSRLGAFALSGFLCGFAGVLLAHHQRAAAETSFQVTESLDVFLYGVVGGVGSVSGALLGAGYYTLTTLLQGRPIAGFLGPIGILLILYMAPGGLTSLAFGLRDSVLRIVAQRRQLVVPSLFADLDPEAAALQLAPLADPLPQTGLGALPITQRYLLESQLHGLRTRAQLAGRANSPVRERSVIGAVAESLEASAQAQGVPVPPGEGGPTA